MYLGNENYNKLYNNSYKRYLNKAENIDIENMNNSLSYIVNAVSEGAKVLDVGCSFGYIGEWLVKNKNCEMFGIDIDNKAISIVKTSGYYKNAVCIDLDNYEKSLVIFKENNLQEFDYIICADVLEHLKNPTEALDLLGRSLKYGGQLVVSLPNVSNIDIILNLLEERFNYSELGLLDNTHLRFFTRKSFFEWIYCSNSFFADYNFDTKYLGYTTNKQTTKYFKESYPYLYDWILKINPRLGVFQNVFTLTKLSKTAKPYTLIDELKNYRIYEKTEKLSSECTKPSNILTDTNPIVYEFIINCSRLKAIELLTATYNKIVTGKVEFSLYYGEGYKDVVKVEKEGIEIGDNKTLRLDYNLDNNELCKAKLVISTQDKNCNLSIWENDNNFPFINLVYDMKNLEIEKSHEINEVWEKANGILNKFYVQNHEPLIDKKFDSDEILSYEEFLYYKEENKKLREIVKELLKELY